MQRIEVTSRFAGPKTMGHGGYVAGLLASTLGETAQVTRNDGGVQLLDGDTLLAEAVAAHLDLKVPAPPTLEAAARAEAGSPSAYEERGVHPSCFGCSRLRAVGDGLRVFAGPCEVDGRRMVAAQVRLGAGFADTSGEIEPLYALATLDCVGAFAFIVERKAAGLLGRIVLERYRAVRADTDLIVTGWQIGTDGPKLLAGSALFDADGTLCAAAKATWFPFTRR